VEFGVWTWVIGTIQIYGGSLAEEGERVRDWR
jgi:hypothetical protein